MNSGFEVYRTYSALKAHFTNKKYDYFKHNGRIKVTWNSYQRRNDKIFFEKLSKTKNCFHLLLYNILENDSWIGEIYINQISLEIYRKHKKINDALSYYFKTELNSINNLKEYIKAKKNTHPQILKDIISNKISLETAILINRIINYTEDWDGIYSNDLMVADNG